MAPLLPERELRRERALTHAEPASLWVVVAGTGLALSVVGWTELALLWFPPHFGSPEWEFSTISAHLSGMPLLTMGLTLLAAGAMASHWRRIVRALAIVCLLVVLSLLVIWIVYMLDVPIAMRAANPQVLSLLKKAMLKAGVFAAVYTLLYGWLARFLWRHARRS